MAELLPINPAKPSCPPEFVGNPALPQFESRSPSIRAPCLFTLLTCPYYRRLSDQREVLPRQICNGAPIFYHCADGSRCRMLTINAVCFNNEPHRRDC